MVSFFAIPCEDFERAFKFYQEVTQGKLVRHTAVNFPMAYFVEASGRNAGHLFQLPDFKPSQYGPIIYFELDRDLNDTILRIKMANGTIIMPKTLITPDKGYWALFLDSEGNRLALHSLG